MALRKKKANEKKEKGAISKNRAKKPSAAGIKKYGGMVGDPINTLLTEYDYHIVLLVIGLTIFGVIMVFSAGYYTTVGIDPYYYLKKQGFFAVLGLVFMYLFARLDYHLYSRKYIYMGIMFASLFFLVLLIPAGSGVNGAVRWLSIGSFRITPSEFSKLAMILFTAAFLTEKPSRIRDFKNGLLPLFVIMGCHALLIIWQPNLSTAIVVCAIMVGIMFFAGLKFGWIGLMAGVLASGTVYILNFMPDSHWYSRLTNWIDPFTDSQGEGYQVSQSLIALGNGGIKGLGLGNSISKNLYLPEPQNDFILAIIGEELGFIGVAILMSVYIIFIWKCFMVAANAKDKLGTYIAAGIGTMLGLQVIINVAVVTASMPATGITLPFVSYGGTSLLIFMMAMGILLNVSRKSGAKE